MQADFPICCVAHHRVLTVLLFSAALWACDSEKASTSGQDMAVECNAVWSGELSGDIPSVKVSACVKQNMCSSDLAVQVADGGRSGPNCENEQCRGHFAQTEEGVASGGDLSLEVGTLLFLRENQPVALLGVTLRYPPTYATTITDADRATLTIRSDTDEMLVDATAAEPYSTELVPYWDPTATCRNALLDFQGAPQSTEAP